MAEHEQDRPVAIFRRFGGSRWKTGDMEDGLGGGGSVETRFAARREMNMVTEATVVAALIGALVAALGVYVSLWLGRKEIDTKARELELRTRELDLRARELENFAQELRERQEGYRETQLAEILKARIEAYPKLWNILLTYGRNWGLERKPRDSAWARSFLVELNRCNAEFGVFFSEPVYAKFHEFRGLLCLIESKLSKGDVVYEEEYSELFKIEIGDTIQGIPGLSTHMKNDLGSYRTAAIQRSARGLEAANPSAQADGCAAA